MPGSLIQVGSDDLIRVKDEGIVVAGTNDACCCDATCQYPPCSDGAPLWMDLTLDAVTFVPGGDAFTDALIELHVQGMGEICLECKPGHGVWVGGKSLWLGTVTLPNYGALPARIRNTKVITGARVTAAGGYPATIGGCTDRKLTISGASGSTGYNGAFEFAVNYPSGGVFNGPPYVYAYEAAITNPPAPTATHTISGKVMLLCENGFWQAQVIWQHTPIPPHTGELPDIQLDLHRVVPLPTNGTSSTGLGGYIDETGNVTAVLACLDGSTAFGTAIPMTMTAEVDVTVTGAVEIYGPYPTPESSAQWHQILMESWTVNNGSSNSVSRQYTRQIFFSSEELSTILCTASQSVDLAGAVDRGHNANLSEYFSGGTFTLEGRATACPQPTGNYCVYTWEIGYDVCTQTWMSLGSTLVDCVDIASFGADPFVPEWAFDRFEEQAGHLVLVYAWTGPANYSCIDNCPDAAEYPEPPELADDCPESNGDECECLQATITGAHAGTYLLDRTGLNVWSNGANAATGIRVDLTCNGLAWVLATSSTATGSVGRYTWTGAMETGCPAGATFYGCGDGTAAVVRVVAWWYWDAIVSDGVWLAWSAYPSESDWHGPAYGAETDHEDGVWVFVELVSGVGCRYRLWKLVDECPADPVEPADPAFPPFPAPTLEEVCQGAPCDCPSGPDPCGTCGDVTVEFSGPGISFTVPVAQELLSCGWVYECMDFPTCTGVTWGTQPYWVTGLMVAITCSDGAWHCRVDWRAIEVPDGDEVVRFSTFHAILQTHESQEDCLLNCPAGGTVWINDGGESGSLDVY
jgi:hypothetical protein